MLTRQESLTDPILTLCHLRLSVAPCLQVHYSPLAPAYPLRNAGSLVAADILSQDYRYTSGAAIRQHAAELLRKRLRAWPQLQAKDTSHSANVKTWSDRVFSAANSLVVAPSENSRSKRWDLVSASAILDSFAKTCLDLSGRGSATK